ncbi:MAG: uroporphyrinogen decarboxylase family protein [Planctomycetota bacterium]
MQNSRDVIDNLLRKKPADRFGVFDDPWDDALRKWLNEGYPRNAEGKPVDAIDHFNFDMCSVGGWFDTMPLRGVAEVIEQTDDWIVTRNGAGAAFKYWKNKSGTPEHVDFRMTSRQIWDKEYRPHLLALDRQRIDIKSAKENLFKRKGQGRWTFYGHLFIWENMRRTMGDICMYESLLLDPDWVNDYNRVYTDFFKAHYRVLLEEAGKPDGIWMYEDLGYNKGLFCSPKILEEMFFPYFKELVDFFHSYDLPVVLHSCGGIEAALPLVVKTGFDALNPMEAKAGCDPLRFAEKYKDKLAFVGGLDARIYESGDRDLIRREITKLVNGMKNLGARYIFGSDHSISTNVRYADFKYGLDVFKEISEL